MRFCHNQCYGSVSGSAPGHADPDPADSDSGLVPINRKHMYFLLYFQSLCSNSFLAYILYGTVVPLYKKLCLIKIIKSLNYVCFSYAALPAGGWLLPWRGVQQCGQQMPCQSGAVRRTAGQLWERKAQTLILTAVFWIPTLCAVLMYNLWIWIRIDFVILIGWIRTQEGKKDPQKRKKLRNFTFWSAGCFLLRVEDFSCSLEVLQGGLGTNVLQL